MILNETITIEAQRKPFILFIIVIFLMTFGIIFSKTNENIGNRREVIAFKGMLISFMIYGLEDLRLISDYFYYIRPKALLVFIMSTGFAAMTFACYFWFLFVSSSINISFITSKQWNIITAIPLVFDLVLLYTPLYRNLYSLTDPPVFKPSLALVLLVDYIYLIAATVISLYKRKKAKNRLDKKKYSGQAFFIIFFTFCGYVVGFLMNLPAIELCSIPIVLKIFVDLQDSKIYTDALTGLNNRRRMNEYINEEIMTCSVEKPLTVIMIDVDYFKSINDILGHKEGDKALKAVANALTKMVDSKYAMAARWGGDEFVIAGKEPDLDKDFREKLGEIIEDKGDLSYTPLFSVGVYKCVSSLLTADQIMVEVDNALYKDKEVQHIKGVNFPELLKSIFRSNKK